jgi:hypothetical protein
LKVRHEILGVEDDQWQVIEPHGDVENSEYPVKYVPNKTIPAAFARLYLLKIILFGILLI